MDRDRVQAGVSTGATTVLGAIVGRMAENGLPGSPLMGAALGAIAGLIVGYGLYKLYQEPVFEEREHRRSLEGSYEKSREENTGLRHRIADLEKRVHKRRIEVDLLDVCPRVVQDGVLMLVQVRVLNKDEPTVLQHLQLHMILEEDCASSGWFLDSSRLDKPHIRDAQERMLAECKRSKTDDLRKKTATTAFGNGSKNDGWLMAFFPGITDADLHAGAQVNVSFLDSDNKKHGAQMLWTHKKGGLSAMPGLADPDAS